MIGESFLAAAILGLFVAQFGMWFDLRALKRREQLRERGLFQ